jgi:N utilization substance protein B
MSGRRTRGLENHQARTLALQVLFETDLTDHELPDVMRRYSEDLALPEPVRNYLERLVTGVSRDRTAIDGEISTAAPAFPVAQLPAVDRNILRLAIYELRNEPDVPVKAAINEAIELAKAFGGENSSRFVNGVLGTIAGTVRRDSPASRDDAAE